MANKSDYVDLGLACADVCSALDRGMNGMKLDDLDQSVREAINQLTMWVQPAMHSSDSILTMIFITELWRRSIGRSSSRVDGTWSLGFSNRGMIEMRSPLGGWTSAGSSKSLTYIQSFPLGRR